MSCACRWLNCTRAPACLQADYLDPAKPFTIPGLFVSVLEGRFGNAQLGQLLSIVPLIAIFNTTVMTMATASRSALTHLLRTSCWLEEISLWPFPESQCQGNSEILK